MGRIVLAAVVSSGLGVIGLAGTPAPSAGAATPAWHVTTSPDRGTTDNFLHAVSCLSATQCVAVGSHGGATSQTLIEHSTNGVWSLMTGANRGSGSNDLVGVSCIDAADCIAVGSFVTGSTNRTLIESLAAGKWSLMSSPNVGSGFNFLNSVSCGDATHCIAVGEGAGGALIESLSGGTWSLVPNPSGGGKFSLDGVDCPSTTHCVAVGTTASGRPASEMLSGGVWSVLTTPKRGTLSSGLSAVSCPTSSRCYAAGFWEPATSTTNTLIERLSGTTWTAMTSPNVAQSRNEMSGISCSDTSSCTAVGLSDATQAPCCSSRNLVLSRTGGSWSVASAPDPGGADVLRGVACPTAATCVAVGSDETGSAMVNHSLVLTRS